MGLNLLIDGGLDMMDFLRWYADIFSTREGVMGFMIVAIIVSVWLAAIELMIDNRKKAAKEKKRKEELDKFN